MAGMDKVTRILILYAQLRDGKRIYKKSFCVDTQIDRRTFDRDIEDIRLFLSETFSGNELVYDYADESYYLKNLHYQQSLSGMDITMILEILNQSQVLRKDEFSGLISTVLGAGETNKRKLLKNIMDRYIQNYNDDGKSKAILKMQWDLQQCIAECDIIKLCMEDNSRIVCCPVALHLHNREFYLFAYDEAEKLVAFSMGKIESFQMMNKKFQKGLIEKFDSIRKSTLQKEMEKGCKKDEKC